MNEAYERARQHSELKLSELRHELSTTSPKPSTVVTFGSYARREASNESDIDYIVVGDAPPDHDGCMSGIERAISHIVALEPSPDGAFAKFLNRRDFLTNLGGPQDTNSNLTCRLKILLEGE